MALIVSYYRFFLKFPIRLCIQNHALSQISPCFYDSIKSIPYDESNKEFEQMSKSYRLPALIHNVFAYCKSIAVVNYKKYIMLLISLFFFTFQFLFSVDF